MGSGDKTIYTIGHSTHTIEQFIRLLQAFAIAAVVDVRAVPRSRRNPQFSQVPLAAELAAQRIEYTHLEGLGGHRRTTAASINTGWQNRSFRGYADYMQTPEFAESLERLVEIAGAGRTAIMCAEAVPWRCHRSLIGDALLVRGIPVVDILRETSSTPHVLTPWARIMHSMLTYPSR